MIYNHPGGSGPAPAGGERPPITAAAVACAFSAGEYNNEYAKKWIKFCKENIPIGKGRLNHDEYQNYYFSQAVYVLGEDGYEKMFPGKEKDPLKPGAPSGRRCTTTSRAARSSDGSWTGGYIGPVFATAINLTILQLENGTLPIYQR